jgi:AraC-like DNA-binding protein
MSKFSKSAVRKIRERFLQGEDVGDIAKSYHVSYSKIYSIIRGRTYTEFTGGVDLREDDLTPRLSNGEVMEIREKYKSGSTVKELMVEYDISETNVKNLLTGKTYWKISGGKDILKGRRKKSHASKTTARKVRNIIADYAEDKLTIREISLKREIAENTVTKILKGITHKNITDGIDRTKIIPEGKNFHVVFYEHIGYDWQSEYRDIFRSKQAADKFIEEHEKEMENVNGVIHVNFNRKEMSEKDLRAILTVNEYCDLFPIVKGILDKYS